MKPDLTPKGDEPNNAIIPEDDARLQAIEALEARETDLDIDLPSEVPASQPQTPQEPVVTSTPVPIVEPMPVIQPEPVAPPEIPQLPEAPQLPVEPVPAAPPVPEPVLPQAPAGPKTPADEMAEAIANEPPTKTLFQPFLDQARLRPGRTIAIIAIGMILLGVGGYFAWQYLL